MKIISLIFTFIVFLIGFTIPTYAVIETPQFPVCSSTQGELVAEYSSGTHGVPGDSNSYTGNDKVYKLTDDTLIQCFCPENGDGIQTNWWKVDIELPGWIHIPDGSLWGLEKTSYLAQNSTYLCNDGGIGGPGSGDIGPPGISTVNLLGLAGTGDSAELFSLGILGLLFVLLGAYTRSHETK